MSKNLLRITLFAFLILAPIISFAQGSPATVDGKPCNLVVSGKLSNPINVCSITDFIKTLLEGVVKIGIPIIVLAIIYSGFLFVEARGNSEKLTKAKSALLYTIIGAAILLGSWAIAMLISETVIGLSK